MSSHTTLVILGHPDLSRSRTNTALTNALKDLPELTLHDIYWAYPERRINVPAEQRLIRSHQILVLQFPLYWYAPPGFLKQWLDDVLQRGFAYNNGPLLTGKTLQLAVTTGSHKDEYRASGQQRFTIEEFLRPLEQTARKTGLAFAEPFVIHSADTTSDADLARHAARYRMLLKNGPQRRPVTLAKHHRPKTPPALPALEAGLSATTPEPPIARQVSGKRPI
jgi:glutathione-regulated potassium-efflux system ancillary protein KefG